MERNATPDDLPFQPSVETEEEETVIYKYIQELKEVDSPEALLAFTKRWEAMYRLKVFLTNPSPPAEISPEHEALINGTYNSEVVFNCIQTNRKELCVHMKEDKECISAEILMPIASMLIRIVSIEYDVTSDVALIKLTKYHKAF